MKRRPLTILFVSSLALTIAASAFWIRSYWISDWLSLIHRQRPGSVIGISIATLRGACASSLQFSNGDYGDPRNTFLKYSPQSLQSYIMPPFKTSAPRWLGFGLSLEHHYFQLILPFWFPTILLLSSTSLLLTLLRRALRRQQQGLCPTCGYDLRASPSLCPECGNNPNAPTN
jgi:hypothetical protein